MLNRGLKHFLIILTGLGMVLVLYLFVPVKIKPAQKIVWGVTFTKSYAQYLGLDWRQTYLAILDDLPIQVVRLGLNWDEIEPAQGQFDFADYDWMFAEAEKRGVAVVPALGFKLPRWPECRAPQWARDLLLKRRDKFEAVQLKMLSAAVRHFQARTNLKMWQVENEGFIGWFGDCPKISKDFVRREVELVRKLDGRPILMTESGELSLGLRSALLSDAVGTSLYREVWNPFLGLVTYPLPPSFYAHKGRLLKLWTSRFLISELQLEAWAPSGILNMPLPEQLKILPPEKMRAFIAYARLTGLDEIYAWGAEWWWFLKLQGYPELWETAHQEFAQKS